MNPFCHLKYVICQFLDFINLRILASYEAKIAKICNFWTFCSVGDHLAECTFQNRTNGQNSFCQIFKDGLNYQPKWSANLFSSCIASILNTQNLDFK